MAVATIGIASSPLLAAEASPAPHENPATAPWVFDGVSLLGHYSETLDCILARDPEGVKLIAGEMPRANTPDELEDAIGDFMSSGHALAQLVLDIDGGLATARALLSQFRPEEAEEGLGVAARKLAKAYLELKAMEGAAQDTGQWFGVASTPGDVELRSAYSQVEEGLLSVRSLLDLLRDMLQSLRQQIEELEEPRAELFRPTQLTLSVRPVSAFVGDEIGFWGSLTSEGEPLPGRRVTVLLDGAPADTVQTGPGGTYRGSLVLPYRYVPEMTVQALFYPQGDDIGLYLGCSSPVVTVKTLFYNTRLSLSVPGQAYPGRELAIAGKFDYGSAPLPQSRTIRVYWNGEAIASEAVAESFTFKFNIDGDTAPGKYDFTVFVTAQKRYAPTWATVEVEVVKVVPAIDIDAPGMVLLPLGFGIKGKAYSALGPLQDASLRIGLGDWEMTTTSLADGSFNARVNTGMSLTLGGPENLEVRVMPKEPWHAPSYAQVGLWVVNPVHIGGLLLVLVIIVLPVASGMRRLRRGEAEAAFPGELQPAPALIGEEGAGPGADMFKAMAKGSPEAILLTLYRRVLGLILGITAVALRPHHTLREFARQCAPYLGPLAGYFQEFTALVERLLYSRHRLGEEEATRGRQLSQSIEEGLKGESA
ncbi:MAG TPA: DUF4129 domain-containing protein [Dehalococcoidia bacterium]|nr:DUF4129 domain-containing protein [Dehalococcoidia bacterium]